MRTRSQKQVFSQGNIANSTSSSILHSEQEHCLLRFHKPEGTICPFGESQTSFSFSQKLRWLFHLPIEESLWPMNMSFCSIEFCSTRLFTHLHLSESSRKTVIVTGQSLSQITSKFSDWWSMRGSTMMVLGSSQSSPLKRNCEQKLQLDMWNGLLKTSLDT